MAAHEAGVGGHAAAAGEAEIFFEMKLLRRFVGEALHAGGNFHQAFLALALFAARGGDFDAQGLRAIEERRAARGLAWPAVKMQFDGHG
jgi:hypothetical protein